VKPRWDGVMPRYPNVFVSVSDGKPISEIIERAEMAMKRAGISSAERRDFRACVPGQFALAIDYIQEWGETDWAVHAWRFAVERLIGHGGKYQPGAGIATNRRGSGTTGFYFKGFAAHQLRPLLFESLGRRLAKDCASSGFAKKTPGIRCHRGARSTTPIGCRQRKYHPCVCGVPHLLFRERHVMRPSALEIVARDFAFATGHRRIAMIRIRRRQRLTATAVHTNSTKPNGHAPCRKP
jgi:hypothetical protein